LSYRVAGTGRGTGRDDAVDFCKIFGREHNVRGTSEEHHRVSIPSLAGAARQYDVLGGIDRFAEDAEVRKPTPRWSKRDSNRRSPKRGIS